MGPIMFGVIRKKLIGGELEEKSRINANIKSRPPVRRKREITSRNTKAPKETGGKDILKKTERTTWRLKKTRFHFTGNPP